MNKVLTGVTIVLVAGGAALSWWLLGNQPASPPEGGAPQSAAKDKRAADPREHSYLDVDFAQKMIVHNQQGTQMADIAKERATSETVRQLAVSIGEKLSVDIEQYVGWLTEWKETYFNLSDFPEMDGHDMYPTHPGMASFSSMSELRSAEGSAVDELFLRLMITHHEGANEMANSGYLKDMQFGEMIRLKNETAKKQREEIQLMKRLQVKGE